MSLYGTTKRAILCNLCQKSQSFYNPFPEVQALLKSKVERIVDKQLAISFNFARIYWPGDVLPKHIDRDACEWSLTLNLRNEGDPWPFYVKPEKESDVLKFIMNPDEYFCSLADGVDK